MQTENAKADENWGIVLRLCIDAQIREFASYISEERGIVKVNNTLHPLEDIVYEVVKVCKAFSSLYIEELLLSEFKLISKYLDPPDKFDYYKLSFIRSIRGKEPSMIQSSYMSIMVPGNRLNSRKRKGYRESFQVD